MNIINDLFGIDEEEDGDNVYPTYNPSDMIFAPTTMYGDNSIAITPKAYFEQHGYMYDGHFDVNGFHWSEESEGIFAIPGGVSLDEAQAYLTNLGMEYNQKLFDLVALSD